MSRVLSDEMLVALCVELIRLRQSECKHLSIEDIAPKLLYDLLVVRSKAVLAAYPLVECKTYE